MPAAVPLIRPISDLRTDLNDVCAQAQETQQPIFMTKNGKASLVVIDCVAYESSVSMSATSRSSVRRR